MRKVGCLDPATHGKSGKSPLVFNLLNASRIWSQVRGTSRCWSQFVRSNNFDFKPLSLNGVGFWPRLTLATAHNAAPAIWLCGTPLLEPLRIRLQTIPARDTGRQPVDREVSGTMVVHGNSRICSLASRGPGQSGRPDPFR